MSSFDSAVMLLPPALSAGGTQYLLKWSDRERRQQNSATSDDGLALRASHIGCELPDTTLMRITPTQVRIYGHHGGIGQKLRPGGVGGSGPSAI